MGADSPCSVIPEKPVEGETKAVEAPEAPEAAEAPSWQQWLLNQHHVVHGPQEQTPPAKAEESSGDENDDDMPGLVDTHEEPSQPKPDHDLPRMLPQQDMFLPQTEDGMGLYLPPSMGLYLPPSMGEPATTCFRLPQRRLVRLPQPRFVRKLYPMPVDPALEANVIVRTAMNKASKIGNLQAFAMDLFGMPISASNAYDALQARNLPSPPSTPSPPPPTPTRSPPHLPPHPPSDLRAAEPRLEPRRGGERALRPQPQGASRSDLR